MKISATFNRLDSLINFIARSSLLSKNRQTATVIWRFPSLIWRHGVAGAASAWSEPLSPAG